MKKDNTLIEDSTQSGQLRSAPEPTPVGSHLLSRLGDENSSKNNAKPDPVALTG